MHTDNFIYTSLSKASKFLLITAGVALTLSSCKKSDDAEPGDPNILVTGYSISQRDTSAKVLFFNYPFDEQKLPDNDEKSSYAEAVCTSGNDVYVGGGVGGKAVYWKNGVMTVLDTLPLVYSTVSDILVKKGDVHVVGADNVTRDEKHAAYWKNGVRVLLPEIKDEHYDGHSAAFGVAIAGDDVYIVGHLGSYKYGYWKNGEPVVVDDAKNIKYVAAEGDDVYFTGSLISGGDFVPAYWKNGALNEGERYAVYNGIAVKNGEVFIAGMAQTNGDHPTPAYWRNGGRVLMQTGKQSGEALSIFLKGTDVYCAGTTMQTFNDMHATVWKNGNAVIHPNGQFTIATDIAVKD